TALSYLNPDRMQFQYMLEGFDKNWNPPAVRRFATYTNVPPGKYVFRLKASNNDGIWNEKGSNLSIRLKPYFYQTYWFYLALAVSTLFVFWMIYRYRLQSVRRTIENRFRAVVAERTR